MAPDAWRDYHRKAQVLLEAGGVCGEFELWDAAAVLAIHGAILFADAVLISSAGLRSAADDHRDAADLLGVHLERGDAARRQLGALIAVKNRVEYTGERIDATRSRELLKRAKRFAGWCEDRLPGVRG